MEQYALSPNSFYVISTIFFLLALITATGKIDRLYCNKHVPGFKEGKFTWSKRMIRYNPERMRPMSVLLLVIIGFLLLAIPAFGLSEDVLGIVILVIVLFFAMIAKFWAVEKE